MEAQTADVLNRVDELLPDLIDDVRSLVAMPSVSGTDGENEAQAHLAGQLGQRGLEVDHWRIDLDALTSHPDFPGMEVDRTEAWGLVGRLEGAGDGASLMLNGHIDVVPTGDLDAWTDPPFSGELP